MAKKIVGGLMVAGGVVAGLYFGVWWAFIGGIIDVIEQVKAPELSAAAVAFGVAKVVFAGFIGAVSAALLIVPGAALVCK